jgi:hypothetical protein
MKAASEIGAGFAPVDVCFIADFGSETVDADGFSEEDVPRSGSTGRGEPSWSLAAVQAVKTSAFRSVVGQITYTDRSHASQHRNRHSGLFGSSSFLLAWLS